MTSPTTIRTDLSEKVTRLLAQLVESTYRRIVTFRDQQRGPEGIVTTMLKGGLSPKTIDNYAQVVKMVVASAVDKEGEEIYPRKWNHEFMDMPMVVKAKQNTPCFSPEIMSGLATWKKERERMVFILCGAAGLRIGEALGLEIDKHITPDFLTISIEQKVRHCKVEGRLKTMSALRKVDLHPEVAAML